MKTIRGAAKADWAAIAIKTFAAANDFRPFVIYLSTGTKVERLIVPHPSCIRISKKLDKITWEHGAAGKLVFAPRFILRIDTGVDDIVAESEQRSHKSGKRRQTG